MLAGAVTSILGATEGGRCAARIADAVWRAVEFMRIIQEKSGREAGLFASCSSHGVSKFGRCLTRLATIAAAFFAVIVFGMSLVEAGAQCCRSVVE